jgi:hypothetical protein
VTTTPPLAVCENNHRIVGDGQCGVEFLNSDGGSVHNVGLGVDRDLGTRRDGGMGGVKRQDGSA